LPTSTSEVQLIDKKSAVYYIGNSGGYISLPSTTSTWTQWTNFNYNSTSFGKGATALPVQITKQNSLKGIAVLLSDESVIVQGNFGWTSSNSTANFYRLASPADERIVRLVSNGLSNRIYGISETGKLYGSTITNILTTGAANWARIGPSFVTTSNPGSVSNVGGGTYLDTLYAISAIDNTLWAWGDARLMGTGTSAVGATLDIQTSFGAVHGTEPVLVSTDTWSYVGGSSNGFFGIKTDGSIHRLCGYWNGGSVVSGGVSRFTTGTLALSNGRINPILIDNTTVYSKVVATDALIVAYDINNKLHTNNTSGFNLALSLPSSWTSISDMLIEANNSAALIMTTNDLGSRANVARITSNAIFLAWNSSSPYGPSIGWGATAPSNVKPRFKSVTLSPIGNEYIAIKGD